MKKVLVWHQGALGDLILSLPAIRAIREYNGGSRVNLVCRRDMAGIIIENGLAEGVTSNEKGMFGFLFGGPEHHPPDLQAFLRDFDGAFVFMKNRDELVLKNIGRHVRRCHHIRTFPPPGSRTHVTGYQLEQLAELGIEYDHVFPVLGAGRGLPPQSGLPVIAVHPGSGGRKKCWPLPRYLRLMEELHGENELSFAVILGPAEKSGEYEAIGKFISDRGISADIIKDSPVSRVLRELRKVSLFIGNDSGITHLASALGVPAVVIFGPTDQEIWKPPGANVRIVRSDYPCSPCGEDDYRTCTGVECLESVPVKPVLKECRRALRML